MVLEKPAVENNSLSASLFKIFLQSTSALAKYSDIKIFFFLLETKFMYYFIERSVAILKPKRPFLEWVNSTFHDIPQQLTLSAIRTDCNSYLIPEVEEIEDGVNFINSKFMDLFAMELSSWTEDESLWPQTLSLKTFWEWFDVEISPTTVDLSDEEVTTGESKSGRAFKDNTIH